MTEQMTTPVLVAQALRTNNVPRNDIKNLRIKHDARSAMHPWRVVCDSIRARCQLPLVKCRTENEARVTMERIQQKLASGVAVVDADEEHVQAVCSLLIDWEFGEYLDANV